jgi:DNA-binding NtrC family response regulator
MNNVLVIDDEIQICESIKLILEYENYCVDIADCGLTGIEKVKTQKFDSILLDIQMPDLNGFEVLKQIKELDNDINVIIISAFGNVENAVKATRLGAFDFVEKPIDREKLLISVRNAVAQSALQRENKEMKQTIIGDIKIIGSSKPIRAIMEMVAKIAPTDVRVMITGDNGTGKELLARAIHNQSERRNNKFVEVNCAAIPNELIESELFGHEKGSFTGALQQRIGKFELANKGTLFLDEIGDMSLQAQAKVLRAIEDGKIDRVGGNKKIDVDVRIITATNKNLKEEITKGNFREDLYHRLNVIPLHIPQLRERLDDIPLLVEHFAQEISIKHKKQIPKFTQDAIELFKKLPWTGNIRELRNIIERIIIIINKKEISEKDIEFLLPYEKAAIENLIDVNNTFQEFKDKAEKAFILKQLESNDWNISKTSEILDIQRSHLYTKMKKFGIDKGE